MIGITKRNIYLITSYYPYDVGEHFVDIEVNKWSQNPDVNLTILPLKKHIRQRAIPKNIHLEPSLIGGLNLKQYFSFVMFAFSNLNRLFCELRFSYTFLRFKRILGSFLRYCFHYVKLEDYMRKVSLEGYPVFYTYWYTEVTYALRSLKDKYPNITVLTRVHGYDLYEERRDIAYIPFRRQFKDIFIFALSESAKKYIVETFDINPALIFLSPLGVQDYKINCTPSGKMELNIVSCSYMVKVKQIDKLIFALSKLAKQNQDIRITWVHIGSGSEYRSLLSIANKELSNISNIKFNFLGHLDNKFIFEYYKTNKVDIFINVSKSEGSPVSIMEALSCHIPVIAPNVGGISEMISNEVNGYLLNADFTIDDVVNCLSNLSFFKSKKSREAAYRFYKKKYDADKNYYNFIKQIKQIK